MWKAATKTALPYAACETSLQRRIPWKWWGLTCAPSPLKNFTMEDLEGNPLEEPRKPQMQFYLQLPCPVPAYSILRKAVDLSAK